MTRRPRKAVVIWAAVAVAVVGVILLIGPGSQEGEPLDPASTSADGTRGLVDTLDELGARVSVRSGPVGVAEELVGGRADTALLLVDNLSDEQRRALTGWTEAGGTLVVADPSSPLVGGSRVDDQAFVDIAPFDAELERGCSVPALRRVDRVVSPGAVPLPVPSGATGCFSPEPGGDAWLVVMPSGRGSVVGLGGAVAFTNSELDRADNALLAVDLLAPHRGDEVVVLWVSPTGSGRESLVDLVPTGVRLALLQLGLAFVVFALWRARRLGRPVTEHQLVEVEGSEWVAAVGRLLQRARSRPQAAAILRDDLRRTLTARLGLPAEASLHDVADAASVRSGVPARRFLEVLGGEDPRSEEDLVGLARSVESLRKEVAHGQ